jgi:hypothetical protein
MGGLAPDLAGKCVELIRAMARGPRQTANYRERRRNFYTCSPIAARRPSRSGQPSTVFAVLVFHSRQLKTASVSNFDAEQLA